MDTNGSITRRTLVAFRLPIKKRPHSPLFQKVEILDHTHIVPGSVACIQAVNLLAQKVLALATELKRVCSKSFTATNSTFLVPRQTPRTLPSYPKIGSTNHTIHAARSN